MAASISVSVQSCDGKRASGQCDGRPFTAARDEIKWRVENINDFSFGQRVAIAKAIRKCTGDGKEGQASGNVINKM